MEGGSLSWLWLEVAPAKTIVNTKKKETPKIIHFDVVLKLLQQPFLRRGPNLLASASAFLACSRASASRTGRAAAVSSCWEAATEVPP